MAFTIASNVGASMSAASGRPGQGHIQYALNQEAWVLAYLSGTQSLSGLYCTSATQSSASWTAPTGSPFTLAKTHNSEGRNFGFVYLNKSSIDILHMSSSYLSSNEWFPYQSRFTLGTTWSNTNAEATIGTPSSGDAVGLTQPSGCAIAIDTGGTPHVISSVIDGGGTSDVSGMTTCDGSHADSGASWTAGFGAPNSLASPSNWVQSSAMFPLASLGMLAVCDNNPSGSTFTNLTSSKLSSGTWSAGASPLAASVTSTDVNAWGAAQISSTNTILLSLSNNSNAYVARTYNGSAWSNLGAAPGTLAYGTTSGIPCVSDGTNLWAFVADSSKNVQYNKWSGSSWGGWTVLEATRPQSPTYLCAAYSAAKQQIMIVWTESTGSSNFNINGSVLSTGSAPSGASYYYPGSSILKPQRPWLRGARFTERYG